MTKLNEHMPYKYIQALSVINQIIDAWDSLEGNKKYSPKEIEDWLNSSMRQAISNARKFIGEQC